MIMEQWYLIWSMWWCNAWLWEWCSLWLTNHLIYCGYSQSPITKVCHMMTYNECDDTQLMMWWCACHTLTVRTYAGQHCDSLNKYHSYQSSIVTHIWRIRLHCNTAASGTWHQHVWHTLWFDDEWEWNPHDAASLGFNPLVAAGMWRARPGNTLNINTLQLSPIIEHTNRWEVYMWYSTTLYLHLMVLIDYYTSTNNHNYAIDNYIYNTVIRTNYQYCFTCACSH